ncbi:TPA: hypothetical protein ACH3X3_014387 [Trebouxia sp. C0006]
MKSCGHRMSLEDCLRCQQLYIIVDKPDGKEHRPLEPLMTSGMPDMTRAENHLLSMEVNIAENETTSSILLEDLVVRYSGKFRLMVRARDRSNNDQDLAHITSESLEVTTQRVKGARKPVIPSSIDLVGRLEDIGKETVKKLLNFQVAEFNELRQCAKSWPEDFKLLKQVLGLLNSKTTDHADGMVLDDERKRLFRPEGSLFGLIYACEDGQVKDHTLPLEAIEYTDEGQQGRRMSPGAVGGVIVDGLIEQAEKQWKMQDHPGWNIFEDVGGACEALPVGPTNDRESAGFASRAEGAPQQPLVNKSGLSLQVPSHDDSRHGSMLHSCGHSHGPAAMGSRHSYLLGAAPSSKPAQAECGMSQQTAMPGRRWIAPSALAAPGMPMQGNLSPPQTTYPAIPDSTPLSTPPPDFSLPAYTTASPQSAFVSSLPAPRPRLDPHAPTLQDLGSVSAMRFTQAQPLPASPSHHWLPSHAYVGSIEPIMSGRAVVDRAVCHSNGLHGQYASAHQQQPQSSSFDCTERSYPAADSSLGASAAAYSDEETACNVSENPVSQQQTVNGLYGGVPAQPSPSTRYLARGNGETSLAQPELEQQARRWDVQRAEWGASQVPELRSDRGLDVTIADIGGDDALAADFVAELDHLLSADHIPNGFAAAESGNGNDFAQQTWSYHVNPLQHSSLGMEDWVLHQQANIADWSGAAQHESYAAAQGRQALPSTDTDLGCAGAFEGAYAEDVPAKGAVSTQPINWAGAFDVAHGFGSRQDVLQDSTQPPAVSYPHSGLQRRSWRNCPVSEEQQQPPSVPQSNSVQLDQAHTQDQAPASRRPPQARGLKRSFSMSLYGLLLSFMFGVLVMDTIHLTSHDQDKLQGKDTKVVPALPAVYASGPAFMAYNLSATSPFQEMQREEKLNSCQANFVGGILTDLEAALVLQGLNILVQKASAEVASSKLALGSEDTRHQGNVLHWVQVSNRGLDSTPLFWCQAVRMLNLMSDVTQFCLPFDCDRLDASDVAKVMPPCLHRCMCCAEKFVSKHEANRCLAWLDCSMKQTVTACSLALMVICFVSSHRQSSDCYC